MKTFGRSFEPQRAQSAPGADGRHPGEIRDRAANAVPRSIPAFAGMTTRLLLCALCVLCGSIAEPLSAQARKPLDGFDAYVAKAVKDWKVPGLAIAVVKDDSLVFAKGYGVREIGKPDPVDANTRFAIGSTTKAMTVAALGMLVDEGKLKWDDKVTKYVPDFELSDPWVTRELTVRDLLTHRAGLGNADLLWAGADYPDSAIFRRVRYLPLAYSMRSGFIYQNIMYALAGEVVHRVSGMPWEQFLRTRIFAPLGMNATEPLLASLAGQPNVATPHAEIDDTMRVVKNRTVDPVKAAGSVWSSVNDMSKWMRFILDSGRANGKQLLATSTVHEILSPQTIADRGLYPALDLSKPHFFLYGLGWFLQDYDGQAVAMHTGSIDGMSAIIALIPDKKLGVYVLANGDHAELRHALMYTVFDRYSGSSAHDWSKELLAYFDKQEADAREAQKKAEARHVTDTHPSLPIARYVGTYSNPTYGDVVITATGDTLHAHFGSAYDGSLSHWQYDTFRAQWADRRNSRSMLVFQPDGTGGVASLKAFGATFARTARP
jgi:CubicO group peptidase (beta-lactamase class C family)